jgi:hypothetical protein
MDCLEFKDILEEAITSSRPKALKETLPYGRRVNATVV